MPASAQPSAQLPVVILPGFHAPALTDQFVRSLPSYTRHFVIEAFPTDPLAVCNWLQAHFPLSANQPPAQRQVPLVGIGFSAGAVGLAGGLAMWQQTGGLVARVIAVDGWGVPVVGLPVTRISHDRFTHVSTLPLGAGDVNFYAKPAVPHLQLWREPEAVAGLEVRGWQSSLGLAGLGLTRSTEGVSMTAASFLRRSLHAEWNAAFNWRTALS